MTPSNANPPNRTEPDTNHNHKPDIRKANVSPPLPKGATVLDKWVYWFGIGLGSGLPKRAPGTWGTVGGLIVSLAAG